MTATGARPAGRGAIWRSRIDAKMISARFAAEAFRAGAARPLEGRWSIFRSIRIGASGAPADTSENTSGAILRSIFGPEKGIFRSNFGLLEPGGRV